MGGAGSGRKSYSKIIVKPEKSNYYNKKIPIIKKKAKLIASTIIKKVSVVKTPEKSPVNSSQYKFFQPSSKMKSWIWKWYMISQLQKHVKCKLCGSILPRSCGSTTSLARHLTKNHYEIVKTESMRFSLDSFNISNASTTNTALSTSISFNESFKCMTETFSLFNKPRPTPLKRKLIRDESEEYLSNFNEYNLSKRIKIKESRVTLPCELFQKTLSSLNSFYEDPTNQLVESKNMNELKDNLTNEIKKSLNSEDIISVCLSSENWISKENKSYLGLTAHYIDGKFNEMHQSFGLKQLPYTQMAYENIINEWNLENKVKYLVSSIKDASDMFQFKNLPCTCKTINLCVKDVVTPNHIDKSEELDLELDSDKFLPALILKCQKFSVLFARITGKTIDSSSNWTSIYSTLHSLFENKEHFDRILLDEFSLGELNENYPTQNEFIYIKDFLKIFEVLKRISVELSVKKYPMCSIIYPGIYFYLKHLKEMTLETVEFEDLKIKLMSSIRKRFSYLLEEDADLFLSLSFLDYRFKFFRFFDDLSLAELFHDRVRNFLRKHIGNNTTEMNEFENEFNFYLQFQPQVYGEKPLDFYRKNQNIFPILSQLARQLLCITGSAVPSDRVFSPAGKINDEVRNRFDESKIEFITFIKDNFDLC